ncbi:MAG TPA: tetratricopeptide repeat protein [Bacteroidia bacterium]|jgi:tetratricopeptide (TPR) repeat protein
MIRHFFTLLFTCSVFLSASAQGQEMDPMVKSGIQKYDAKNFAGALQDFSSFISKNKPTIDKYLKDKAAYDKLTEYEKALVENAQLLDRRNDLAMPYYYRGMCNLNTGNKDAAMQDFDMAIQLDSKYPDPLYQRGKMLVENGKKEEGCIQIRTAADLGSAAAKELYEENFCWNASLNYMKEGTTKFNLGQYNEAINDFDLAIKLNPDSANLFNKRGQCYYALGKFDKALLDFGKALERDSSKAEYYFRKGLCYYSQEKHQQAFSEFSKAIQMDNNYADAYLYRAYSCEGMANSKSAIYDYGQVIRIKPEDGLAYFKRGLLKQDMKDHTACKDFKQAAALGYEDAADYAASCK